MPALDRWRGCFLYTPLLIVLATLTATAEVTTLLLEERFDCLQLKGARAMAVSEQQQQLAVAAGLGDGAAVWLLQLDRHGAVVKDGALPLPPPVTTAAGEPIALLYHPQLPLLYLWQRPPGQHKGAFEPLLVYDVADPRKPQVVTAACSQVKFDASLLPARLALDQRARRLYLPNLRQPIDDKRIDLQVGFVALDEQGLPVRRADGELVLTQIRTGHTRRYPAANGMEVMGDQILLSAAWRGLIYWDSNNRQAGVNAYVIPDFPVEDTFVAAGKEWIYIVSKGNNRLIGLRHVVGYPTLLPHRFQVPQATFYGPPVVMQGQKPLLAIPGKEKIHTVELGSDGALTDRYHELKIAGLPESPLLIYAPRFDRLYIAVEELL